MDQPDIPRNPKSPVLDASEQVLSSQISQETSFFKSIIQKFKSNRKILLYISVPLMIIVFLILLKTNPSLEKMNICFDNYNSSVKKNTELAVKQSWDRKKMCLEEKFVLDSISFCYEGAGKNTFFSYKAIESLQQIMRPGAGNLRDWANLHNSNCSAHADTIVHLD